MTTVAGAPTPTRTVVDAFAMANDLCAADRYARLTKSRPILSSMHVCDIFTD